MLNEINGLTIEKWNIHGFDIGGKTIGRIQTTCPFCSQERKKKNDKCCSVNLDTAFFQCWHCGERGQLHSYKREHEQSYEKPPAQSFQFDYSDNLIKWFENRGISKSTLRHFKITEGPEWMPQENGKMNTVKFNYFLGGELINIKYRDRKKNFKLFKGAEKIFYNLDSIMADKECVIVEGEIDCLSFYEAGVSNAISVPNGFNLQGNLNMDYLTSCYEYFENKEKIFLAVDNDEAGKKGERELARRLGAEKIYLVDFGDCKDANEFLIKHGKLKLQELLKSANQFPLENVITIADQWESLEDFWTNGAPKGLQLGLKHMDNAISLDWKQYTLMLSAPGSGKSEKVDDIVIRSILKYGIKAGFCSTENEPFYLHYDKLFKKVYGFRPRPHDLSKEEIGKTKEFLHNHIYHVQFEKRYELKAVLKKFEELVKRKGVRLFILDPFNKIKLDGVPITDVNQYTQEYHMLIDEFVKKNDCHLIMILHPTKLPLKEGSRKTYIMPTAYHAKGGGEHFDMSYNILGMVRDHERNLIHFQTLKVKFQHLGTAGVEWFEGWNINNGRFAEVEDDYDTSSTHEAHVFWDNRNWLQYQPESKIEEEQLPDKEELPAMTAAQAFGPAEEVPDQGTIEDDDFEADSDIPF